MLRYLLFALLLLNAVRLGAQCDSGNGLDLYWRAGSGNFNDPTRWEVGSAGSGVEPCQAPRSEDNVFFPAASFPSATTITLDINSNCRDMIWEAGALSTARLLGASLSTSLDVYGDLALSTQVIWDFDGELRLKSVRPAGTVHTIQTAGRRILVERLVIEPTNVVEYRLVDDLYVDDHLQATNNNLGGQIAFNSGFFNTNGRSLRADNFSSQSGNAQRRLDIRNSRVEMTRNDRFGGTAWTAWSVDFNRATNNFAAFETAGSHLIISDLNTSWVYLGTGIRYDTLTFGRAYNNPTTENATLLSYVTGINDTFSQVNIYRRVAAEGTWTLVANTVNMHPFAHLAGGGVLNLTTDAINVLGGCGSFPSLASSGMPTRSAGYGWNGSINLTKLTAGVLNLQQLIIGRVTANTTGGRSYTATNCADKGANSNISFGATAGRALFFRDAGDRRWHTLANWQEWDGFAFAPAACLPTPFDDVYFDGSSFPNAAKRLLIMERAVCKDMRWLPTVAATAEIQLSSVMHLFGTLEWAATMTAARFVGGNYMMLCSQTQDSIISNGAINNTINIHLDNDADYRIFGNYQGLIGGGPGCMMRAAATDLRPFGVFYFSRAVFDGTQVYVSSQTLNQGATVVYSGNATFHLQTPGSELWMNHLPNVIVYSNAVWQAWPDFRITGNLELQEDATAFIGVPTQRTSQLNVVGGLNGAAGNASLQRGSRLIFANFNNTSALIQGNLTLAGDCQKMASIQTFDGQPMNGATGFRLIGSYSIQNAYIQGMKNTSAAPNASISALNSIDGSNNTNVVFTASASNTYYWRALTSDPTDFTGNWSDAGHWTTNPANLTGDNGCVPSGFDDVVFDNLSFSGSSNGCTVSSASFCRDVYIQAAQRFVVAGGVLTVRDFNVQHSAAVLESSTTAQQIFIGGSLLLAPNMPNMRYRGDITLNGLTGNIQTQGTPLQIRVLHLNRVGGVWQMLDGLDLDNAWAGANTTNTHNGELRLSAGTLHTNSHPLSMSSFFNASLTTQPRALHLGSSLVTHRLRAPHQNNGTQKWAWNINPTNFVLTSNADAQINFGPATVFSTSVNIDFFMGNGLNYPNVRIFDQDQPLNLYGNTGYRYLDLEGNFLVDGNTSVDSLRLVGGYTYRFRSGSLQTLRAPHGRIISNGTSSSFINIEGATAGLPFTLRKAYGEAFCIDYVKVKDCIGAKETNMLLVPTTPTDYQLIQPFLEFQTGTNSDNIGGTATGIWAFNLPPLVLPQYSGGANLQLCRTGTVNYLPLTMLGTSPYVLSYTWTDNLANAGNSTLLVYDDDSDPNTPYVYPVAISSTAGEVYYTLNLRTSRCGEFTPNTISNITVTQPAADLLVSQPRANTCTFNNENVWLTLLDPVDERPMLSLLDQVSGADTQPLGSVSSEVFFDATIQYYFDGTFSYPYLRRHWQITPTNNDQARVRLYFTQAELDELALATYVGAFNGTLDPATQIQVRKFTGNGVGVGAMTIVPHTVTTLSGAAAQPFSSTANVICVEFYIPSFSHFIITPTLDMVLPIELAGFSAEKLGTTQALLKWQLESETDVLRYEIERSRTGAGAGERIGEVAATGATHYSFIDNAPLAGANYYRLRAVDIDGSAQYSDWRVLDFGADGDAPAVQLLPNPTNGNTVISLSEATAVEVRLFNHLGQLVDTQQFPAQQNRHALDVSRLPSGIYTLQIQSAGAWVQTLKLVRE